jgi:type II secretory pathway pseudopilin PulG
VISSREPALRPGRQAGRDAGETLVELLITIAVIGVCVPSVLGAVLYAVHASSTDARVVQAQSLLTSWAERLAAAPYTDCATTTTYQATSPYAGLGLPALPSGFTPTYSGVTYWNGSTWVTSCPPDKGVQRVQLTMTVDVGLTTPWDRTMWVTLRKPCTTNGSCS